MSGPSSTRETNVTNEMAVKEENWIAQTFDARLTMLHKAKWEENLLNSYGLA